MMFRTSAVAGLLWLLCFSVRGQGNACVTRPMDQWPVIAMVNEVWYTNGERYVHPSFEYVATGFLVDTGTDTVAATVKHALWVAKMKSMNTVDLRGLRRWVMHPKGSVKDSVVMDYVMNQDTTEILNGPLSSITQRDWLVFKIRYASPAIQPLKIRHSPVTVGEAIYFAGCPYSERNCVVKKASVIETEGNRIIFTVPENFNVGGFSGSPVLDKDGLLIGILGGSSFDRKTGHAALYGISTHYLQAVLNHQQPLNVPLIPCSVIFKSIVDEHGFHSAIKELRRLIATDSAYYMYDFSMEALNAIGDDLKKQGQWRNASEIYRLNKERYGVASPSLRLASVYVERGRERKARTLYRQVLEKWPDNQDARAGLKKLE